MGNSNSAEYNYTDALMQDKKKIQSVECEEKAEEGHGIPRRAASLKPGEPLATKFVSTNGKSAATLWEVFQLGRDIANGTGNFLGTRKYNVVEDPVFQASEENRAGKSRSYKPSGYVERPDGSIHRAEYVFDTYDDVHNTAIALGAAFRELGAVDHANIGLFAVNRAEWIITELAIYSQSFRVTPLYATLGPDAIEYIINHAENEIVVVSKDNLPSLIKTLGKTPVVKHIVMIDSIFNGRYGNTLDKVSKADIEKCADFDIKLHGMAELISMGEGLVNEKKYEIIPPSAEDIAFIMYTSGTTGAPKGAMILHKNAIAGAAGIPERVGSLTPEQNYLSVLPLAHIFETAAQAFIWGSGAQVFFAQGDIRRLADDLQTSQPAMLAGVPRIFQKFYENVWASIEKKGYVSRWYIKRAYAYQVEQLRAGKPLDETYDTKVFSLIRQALGLNRIRIIVSGAAPCPPYIGEFMRVVSNAHFGEGYGLTETCAGTCISSHPNNTIGHVGAPLTAVMVKLADIAEMGYSSKNDPPTGEILVCADSVFAGYYKNEQNTKESFHIDPNGKRWFMTGDVGRWNPNGTLSIIDRKKNMIKLAQGEYVALERLEDTYGRAAGISQIWVYGNSYKSMVVALIVPDWQYVYNLAVQNGWWEDASITPKAGDHSEEFIDALDALVKRRLVELTKLYNANLKGEESQLLGFEKIKAIRFEGRIDILGNGFTEEKGTLTPTMKKKRKQLSDMYIDTLKEMYTALGEPPKGGETW